METGPGKPTYESSLKARELDDPLDRFFYRKAAFPIAKVLRSTRITPNMVTILSIFVGVGGGVCFYFNSLIINLTGILLLILANLLDCVDGQLARITGIKSRMGRILDGVAGNLWFIIIYFALCFSMLRDGITPWIFAAGAVAGFSNMVQSAMCDYFKNLNLLFLKGTAGSEMDDASMVISKFKGYSWKDNFWQKLFFFFYRNYTVGQESVTPNIQRLKRSLGLEPGKQIPDSIRAFFNSRAKSAILFANFLTFNSRSMVLFPSVLLGVPWIYFIYEIIFLNISLAIALRKHEKLASAVQGMWMCPQMTG